VALLHQQHHLIRYLHKMRNQTADKRKDNNKEEKM
jgi:hypothetical protein